MTDEQLIEEIAELLFNHEEIDAWWIYDALEDLFNKERPQLKIKYDEVFQDQEIQERNMKIQILKNQILKLQEEIEMIKSES
jgi:polyhydroxyalkanoate synthesis regulator phasin